MWSLKYLKNQKGILLLEALIALAVVVIVMTALVTALVSAISTTNFSKEQSIATAYAQEGLDYARAFKNRDFSTFSSLANGKKNLGSDLNGIPSGTGLLDNEKYYRYLYLNQEGVDGLKPTNPVVCVQSYTNPTTLVTKDVAAIFVASVVEWSDSRCSGGVRCHKVELSSCFANLNSIEGP